MDIIWKRNIVVTNKRSFLLNDFTRFARIPNGISGIRNKETGKSYAGRFMFGLHFSPWTISEILFKNE